MEGDSARQPGAAFSFYFDPRPHLEGDLYDRQPLATRKGFLPTPSHGGRLFYAPASAGDNNFYPRPHMEGDIKSLIILCVLRIISTHALTWRATPAECTAPQSPWNFYPRPHMEGDGYPRYIFLGSLRFLPTPSHGGRQRQWSFPLPLSNFYPRPHMEGDMKSP